MLDTPFGFWLAFTGLFAMLLLLWAALGLINVIALTAVTELVLQRMEARRIRLPADFTDRPRRG